MARSIDVIDKYRLQFFKPAWQEHEVMAVHCLGFKFEGTNVIVDTRATMPDALKQFMAMAFPTVLLASSNRGFKEALFQRLNDMYTRNFKEFKDTYYNKLGYPHHLYKYQQKDLGIMIYRQMNLCSYEQGLGKTITSASISKLLNIRRTAVIAPTLPKWNWYLNLTDDWGYNQLYWSILDAKKSKSIKAFKERFVITNYEQINNYIAHFERDPIGHIILDECQQIKNPSTNRWKGVKRLIDAHPNARVTLLTGTPVTNRVVDLFGYLKITGHPLGRNKLKFKKRYTTSTGRGAREKITGSQNLDELRLLISNFMIRRRSDDELDLPPLNIIKYYFEAGEIGSEYDEIMEEMYQNSQEYERAEGKEKRQIGTKLAGNIHSLNRIVSTSKAKPISELINSIREEGRKVIVFAGYKNALGALEDIYGKHCVKIDGSVDAHKRQELIDKFKNDPECFLFLGNMKAAGVGINLVNARDVIFMNFPFTPDDLEQPYKRAHRIGQNKSVNVYYTIARETIDERTFGMIQEKTVDINELIDAGKTGVVHYANIQGRLWKDLIADYEQRKTGKKKKQGFASVK